MNNPKVFLLKRDDILGQAISHFILRASGYGHSFEPEKKRQARSKVKYNGEHIIQCVQFTANAYYRWNELFKITATKAIQISYENLVKDLVANIRYMLGHIMPKYHVSAEKIINSQTTKKVGDDIDRRLREHLLNDPIYSKNLSEILL